MTPAAVGEAVAGFVVGIWRAVRERFRRRRALLNEPVRRAWCERRHGLWYIRRADGLVWTGSTWNEMGSSYATREDAEAVLEGVVAMGLASKLP